MRQLYIAGNCANILQNLPEQGVSVIPLHGKRPLRGLRWKAFQKRLPTIDDVTRWTANPDVDSYGIICGRVSGGLFVIDFDSPTLYSAFVDKFPSIAETYTVKTRRGFHLYCESEFPVASRSFEKCDLKSENGYVVGAGSCVDGFCYTATNSLPIRQVRYAEYVAIVEWLSPQAQQLSLPLQNVKKVENLKTAYEQQISIKGRNNALYAVACDAHRQGMTFKQVIAELAHVHASTKSNQAHLPETYGQRMREAVNTIKSAFQTRWVRPSSRQLPNSIREHLLRLQNSSLLPRLLDGIAQENLFSQQPVTLSQLEDVARKYHITRRSLRRIVFGDLAKVNRKRIFKQLNHDRKIVSYVSQGDRREHNSRRGRPTRFLFEIPTHQRLAELLGVDMSLSDTLFASDLSSANAYRRALHRELIGRLSPIIRVDWYAERLGVHRRTIFRYNRQLHVRKIPTIRQEKLTVEQVARLSAENTPYRKGFTPGTWLQTAEGKRYPALKMLAVRLMERHKGQVLLCKQLPTRYELPDELADSRYPIQLPDHLKTRGTRLNKANILDLMAPDWAVKKFDLGGYLAVWNGVDWVFRPPLRVVAYQLLKQYEDGVVFYVRAQ